MRLLAFAQGVIESEGTSGGSHCASALSLLNNSEHLRYPKCRTKFELVC